MKVVGKVSWVLYLKDGVRPGHRSGRAKPATASIDSELVWPRENNGLSQKHQDVQAQIYFLAQEP